MEIHPIAMRKNNNYEVEIAEREEGGREEKGLEADGGVETSKVGWPNLMPFQPLGTFLFGIGALNSHVMS